MKSIIENKMSQLRREEGKNFLRFRRLYFAHYHKHPDAPFHVELSGLLDGMTYSRGMKSAIAAPRDSAKSTIISLQYVLYCICYDLEKFILLVSNTSDQAAELLSSVKKELETNELLMRDFPEASEFGLHPKPPRWTKNDIVTRNGIKVLALGSGQQVRGRRNKESRPSLIILDDIEKDESLQNSESYEKLHDWITKAVLKAGAVHTNVVFAGTIHHYGSLLARFVDPTAFPGWYKKVYRSIVSWSPNPQLWEAWVRIFNNQQEFEGEYGPEAAKRYFEAHEKEMLEGTEVLWPESKSYYDLMVLREQEGHYSFDSEMQNEPIDPKNCCFNPEEIHYWDDKFKTEEELLEFVGIRGEFYGACDPSLGRQNRRGDFSAIVTALVDTHSGKIYILDADIARRKPDKTITDILGYQDRRGYKKFGFESNQFQEYMADQLRKESEKKGYYLPLIEIKNTTDKRGRIETLQPLVKNGTILFSRKHHTLLEQMKFFPKGSHDDGLDALEMVVRLCKRERGIVGGTVDHDVTAWDRRDDGGWPQQPIYKIVLPEPNRHRRAY